jgi:hypothetical protein
LSFITIDIELAQFDLNFILLFSRPPIGGGGIVVIKVQPSLQLRLQLFLPLFSRLLAFSSVTRCLFSLLTLSLALDCRCHQIGLIDDPLHVKVLQPDQLTVKSLSCRRG